MLPSFTFYLFLRAGDVTLVVNSYCYYFYSSMNLINIYSENITLDAASCFYVKQAQSSNKFIGYNIMKCFMHFKYVLVI